MAQNPDWLQNVSFNDENKSVEIKIEPGRDHALYKVLGLELGDEEGLCIRLVEELRKFIKEKRNESGA